mgnify:CR=1 FL=1
MEKKELTTDETRVLMGETRGYQQGVEHERRRILAYFDELQRNKFTHASVERVIDFIRGKEADDEHAG